MPRMRLAAVAQSEKPVLWNMLQGYIQEFTAYTGDKPIDGVYAYPPFDNYWSADGHWPFWAMLDDERAGFALIAREPGATRVKEFYVDPKFRRQRIGVDFARQVLAEFPGQWKIRQMVVNAPAVAFWRRVLEGYEFTEERFWDRGLERLEQTVAVPRP